MKIYKENIGVSTLDGVYVHDITTNIKQIVTKSGIKNGIVTVNSMHTTTAMAINEFESRLIDDLRIFLHKLVPPADKYLHNDIHLRDCPDDEPENAHSHLAAMLLSRSESIILSESELQLGQWQSVLLIELDGPRERGISVQVMGV